MKSLLGAIALVAAASSATADTIIVAPHMVMPDGSLAENRAVVIADDGKIRRIIDASTIKADAADVIRFDSGVLSPGLIDVNSAIGVRGNNIERATVIDSEARVVDAVDMSSREFQRAIRAGVTSVMIAPADRNVIAGQCATIHTWSDSTAPDVLNGAAALSIVVSSSTYDQNREPSSRAGALGVLRRAIKEAEEEQGDGALARALRGEIPILVTCENAQDVTWSLAMFGRHGITPTIVHTVDTHKIASHAAEAKAKVVVGPYSFSSDALTLGGAAALHDAGVRVVISGNVGIGDPDRLRIGAALAVLHGLDASAARRAITINAAGVAGVSRTIGSIEAGKLADLVVFSADPLRLDARPLVVWVRGERIYSAASSQYNHEEVIGATHE